MRGKMKKSAFILLVCIVLITLFSCFPNGINNGNSLPEDNTEEEQSVASDETSKEETATYLQIFGEYDDADFEFKKYLDRLGKKYGDKESLAKTEDKDGNEIYTGFYDNPDPGEGKLAKILCRITVYNDIDTAKSVYKEKMTTHHPAINIYESFIRIENVIYSGYNGFVSDVAFYAKLNVPQSAELKFNVGINEVELACTRENIVSTLIGSGYSLYDSKWLSNGEEDPFKRIDSYACVSPKGYGLLIYIVNPQLAYLLASNDKTSVEGISGLKSLLETSYYYTSDGIIIVGMRPYAEDLINMISNK